MHSRRSIGLRRWIWQETGTVMVMTIQLYHFWPGGGNFFQRTFPALESDGLTPCRQSLYSASSRMPARPDGSFNLNNSNPLNRI
jgi:hypothetical protein